MTATIYMVILYPVFSMNISEPKQPVILPIHGNEFIKALRVGGRINSFSTASKTPNRRRKDGRACNDPKLPVSLYVVSV